MDLAAHQRGMLELVRGRRPPPHQLDLYLSKVASSKGLSIVRKIVAQWQIYDVRRSCPLTATALGGGRRFERIVRQVRFELSDAFPESRARAFLTHAEACGGVVGSVATFELALMEVRSGGGLPRIVDWDRDPTAIIQGLLNGRRVGRNAKKGRYRMLIDPALPELVTIDHVE